MFKRNDNDQSNVEARLRKEQRVSTVTPQEETPKPIQEVPAVAEKETPKAKAAVKLKLKPKPRVIIKSKHKKYRGR